MSSSAVVTLKLSSEQFRTLRREMEYLKNALDNAQKELKTGSEEWRLTAQRIMELESLLRSVL